MKKLITLVFILVTLVFLFGCASTQVHQVYVRDEIDAEQDNLLVMPLFGTQLAGNTLSRLGPGSRG